MDYALGEMALELDDFLWMSWGVFNRKLLGHKTRLDQVSRNSRKIAVLVYNANVKKGFQASEEYFWPLPFVDKPRKIKKWTKDEAMDEIKKIDPVLYEQLNKKLNKN